MTASSLDEKTRSRRALRDIVLGGSLALVGAIAFVVRSDPGAAAYVPAAIGGIMLLRGVFVMNG